MNKQIKAVVFDVGGVLCEWEGICREFAREIGMEENKFVEILLSFRLIPKLVRIWVI